MNSDLRREAGMLESLFPERFSSDTWVRPEKDSGTDPDRPKEYMSSDNSWLRWPTLSGIPPERLLPHINKMESLGQLFPIQVGSSPTKSLSCR